MQRTFEEQMQYMIQYYHQMRWRLWPQDILDMCAEEITFGDEATWNFLMDARNHLNNQDALERYRDEDN